VAACVKRISRLRQESHDLSEEIKTIKLPEPSGSLAGDPVGRMRRKIIKAEKAHIDPLACELLNQLEEEKTPAQLARETQRPLGELLEIIVPARRDLKERVERAAGGVQW
jgi:hypothetical protein